MKVGYKTNKGIMYNKEWIEIYPLLFCILLIYQIINNYSFSSWVLLKNGQIPYNI